MANERNAILRGMRMALRDDSTAFAYSVLITATSGIADVQNPPLTVGRIFLFPRNAARSPSSAPPWRRWPCLHHSARPP